MVITATLLTCDAWFDVCLSWGTTEHWSSVAAALVELPVAMLLATTAVIVMRRSCTFIAQLRGQDPTPVPLWRQPMIHVASTRAGPRVEATDRATTAPPEGDNPSVRMSGTRTTELWTGLSRLRLVRSATHD